MLDQGNDNGHYRGTAAEVREWLSDFIEGKSGVARKTKKTGKKDKDGTDIEVYDEPEVEYINRAAASMGWEDLKQFQPDLDAWLAQAGGELQADDTYKNPTHLAISIKERERKVTGPKKLAEKYLNLAREVIKGGKLEKLNKKFHSLLGKTFSETPYTRMDSIDDAANTVAEAAHLTTEATKLGWMVKEYSDEFEKQNLQKLTA